MEFGKLDNINSVNWALPPLDPSNEKVLKEQIDHMLYFGTPAWGAKHWIGKIYPKKTSPEDFLFHYSRSFNCIELNTTHYRIPDDKTSAEWLTKVPENFRFCPKMYKEISHTANGLYDKILLNHWLNFLERIQTNLGPCFIQFHEMFSYKDKAHLFHFLESWPSTFKLSIELRHPSWFQKGVILPPLADYLRKKNVGLVITDVAGRRDVLHSTLSAPWTMIRLIGNNLHQSDNLRLNEWAQRINLWQENTLNETYFFLHQPDDVMTIEFSRLAETIFIDNHLPHVPHIQEVSDGSFFELIDQ